MLLFLNQWQTRTISASETTTPSITKGVGKNRLFSTTANLIRTNQIGHLISSGVNNSSSLVKVTGKNITASLICGVAQLRSIGKNISVNIISTPSILRTIGKSILLNTISTISTLKLVGKHVASAINMYTSVISGIPQFISVLITTIPSIRRGVSYNRFIPSITNITQSRAITTSRMIIQGNTATLIKNVRHSLSTGLTIIATVTPSGVIFIYLVTVHAVVNILPTMTRIINTATQIAFRMIGFIFRPFRTKIDIDHD